MRQLFNGQVSIDSDPIYSDSVYSGRLAAQWV